MLFMNRWEIEDAARYFAGDPVLGPASQTLLNLMEWTDVVSDGWAYWPKPCRASAKLQQLLYRHDRFRREYIDETTIADEYKVALRPIKAFRTRQEADFQIVDVT